MSREPPPPVRLDYAPPRRRGREWIIILPIAGLLLGLLLVMAVFVSSSSTTTVVPGPIVFATTLPAPTPQSTLVPPEGIDISLQQRESKWVAGERLKLGIDDITAGQVRVTLTDDAGEALLEDFSMRQGDHVDLPDPDGAPLRLTLERLTNVLIGEDYAEFHLGPVPPATRPATGPASGPALSEAQKVERLLAAVAEAEDVVFIRNGSEHTAADAAEHLRMKWERGGGAESGASARGFIEQAASRSSLTGREYRVRLPDGREVPSAQWLGEELERIEREAGGPATREAEEEAEAGGLSCAELVAAPAASLCSPARVQDDDEPMNITFPTLGGKQLWTDVRIDPGGWRIQRHALTGHYRVLDNRDRRLAWGSKGECSAAWERLAPPANVQARADKELVVLLHGLFRTRSAMRPMADFFREQGYDVVDFGYASTRGSTAQHAQDLDAVLSQLKGYRQVHFVGHSLGCLIVRRWLADQQDIAAAEGARVPVGRVVMLAPPNNGSQLAARLRRNPVFLLALGPAGQEIADWTSLEKELATPADFGVIAGNCTAVGNPLLDEEGDLIVTVEETKLAGMGDFVCLDATHTFLMRNAEVKRMAHSFLKTGRFAPSQSP